MANPTTNFGWQMPTNTDLVKDLPADFEVFGQAVDTDLADLKGGTTGQVLSKTSGTDLDFTWITPTDQTPLTTKGDLFGYSTADARIPVGANGTVLTADSAEALGVKWATPASGGMTLINTGGTSLSGTTTITSIPATYNYLYLEVVGFKPVSDNAQLGLRFNGDTNNNRYYRSDIATGLGSVGFNSDRFYISAGQDNGSDNSLIIANVYGYANTTTWKMTSGYGLNNNDVSTANINYWTFGGFYNQTAAISSITFVTSTGGITAGTAYLYGVK